MATGMSVKLPDQIIILENLPINELTSLAMICYISLKLIILEKFSIFNILFALIWNIFKLLAIEFGFFFYYFFSFCKNAIMSFYLFNSSQNFFASLLKNSVTGKLKIKPSYVNR